MTEVFDYIQSLTKAELLEKADIWGVPIHKSSKQYLRTALYEHYCKLKRFEYKYTKRIAKGSDGEVYEAKDHRNRRVIVKLFHSKSPSRITKEVELQNECAKHHLSIPIIDYDLDAQYIVMKPLQHSIFDLYIQQGCTLKKKQMKEIQALLKKMDSIGIFHQDPNPANFMYDKRGRLLLIDFGFASPITDTVRFKYGSTPNQTAMKRGLEQYLKDIKKV